ncbi:MAG: ATP-binding protein [Magnetococcales bacterium]|nr:ATP-binding protein [Magnetococcales bacterium]
MEPTILIRSCTPIALTAIGMGPFQEKPFHLEFLNREKESCNFFLLISANARGKTTLLEAMTNLMALLDPKATPASPQKRLWSNPRACAQLDLRLVVNMDGVVREVLLTLAAGPGRPHEIRSWENSTLREVQTEQHLWISWKRSPGGHWSLEKSKDPLIDELRAQVGMEMENVYETFGPDSIAVPSLLYFDAYRDIPTVEDRNESISRPPEWVFRPHHHFGLRGDQWQHSLDNLLVWLTWLDDGRDKEVQDLLNRFVFTGTNKKLNPISRQYMEARVSSGETTHMLDQLSSGEKSLVQLLLRIHLHLTENCVILIDEIDAHLHVKLQHRLYQALKQLIRENPSITLIATTHSMELIDQFTTDMDAGEPLLRLGGHLIDLDEIY